MITIACYFSAFMLKQTLEALNVCLLPKGKKKLDKESKSTWKKVLSDKSKQSLTKT